MRKKIILSILISSTLLSAFSQITIEDCYQKAQENYPLIKQYDLIEKTKEYNLSNVNKGYLPQIMFSAKATYQSDVTEIPINLEQLGFQGITIPTVSQDQYGLTLDINQTIWDGGEIKSQKKEVRATSEVNAKNIEVSLYAINARINQIYFGILLTEAQIHLNQLLKEELQQNYDQIQSYIQNGIANQADLDAVRVDQLKTEQDKIQLIYTRKAYIAMLSELIGTNLDVNTKFIKPVWTYPILKQINRPELSLYDAQIKQYEIEKQAITAGLMPKLGAFITGGYGKPGLDMLENEFTPYYIAGIKLTWNISNLYTQKNRKKLIQTNIKTVETQRATFLFDTNLDITQKDKNIEKYINQIKYDDEIIALRNAVKKASEAKMANGTISGTDLMRDINAAQMAKQNKILHEIELLLAVYDLKFATNN